MRHFGEPPFRCTTRVEDSVPRCQSRIESSESWKFEYRGMNRDLHGSRRVRGDWGGSQSWSLLASVASMPQTLDLHRPERYSCTSLDPPYHRDLFDRGV